MLGFGAGDGLLFMRKSFLCEGGDQALTSLCSFEIMNLLAAGPEKTAVGSPSMLVMKTCEEYFCIFCLMKFSGVLWRNSRVSPIIGHPELPGGRFFVVLELL